MENNPVQQINPDDKLKASSTMACTNASDIYVSFEIWTVGMGFLVQSKNCPPDQTIDLDVEYVWYDVVAKDMNNTTLGKLKGVYHSKEIYLIKINGEYILTEK